MKCNLLSILVCVFAVSLVGCGGGSGDGLDEQGLPMVDDGTDDPDDTDDTEAPSLAQLQADIFTPICSQCHAGSNAPQGLRLDSEDNSYNHLVNQASQEVPQLLRVDPGNPDDSYIVRKIEGAPGIVGGQMPLGGPPLQAEQIQMLRDWISNGAPRNGTGSTSTSLALTAFKSDTAGLTFHVHFSRPLQTETLSDSAIQIYLHQSDSHWLMPPDSYGYSLNNQTLVVEIDPPETQVTAVEIILNDPAISGVLDINGRLVDGDGDAIDGGVYRYVYTY